MLKVLIHFYLQTFFKQIKLLLLSYYYHHDYVLWLFVWQEPRPVPMVHSTAQMLAINQTLYHHPELMTEYVVGLFTYSLIFANISDVGSDFESVYWNCLNYLCFHCSVAINGFHCSHCFYYVSWFIWWSYMH